MFGISLFLPSLPPAPTPPVLLLLLLLGCSPPTELCVLRQRLCTKATPALLWICAHKGWGGGGSEWPNNCVLFPYSPFWKTSVFQFVDREKVCVWVCSFVCVYVCVCVCVVGYCKKKKKSVGNHPQCCRFFHKFLVFFLHFLYHYPVSVHYF